MKKIIFKNQSGQILALALIVMGLVLLNTLVIIGGSQVFFQNTTYVIQSAEAVNLAEAGLDKAVASLNASGGSYLGETETQLGAGSYAVSITSPDPNTKIIESTGYIPSKANPKVKRTVVSTAFKGINGPFNYGVQIGEGGLEMFENTTVNGSVYSNGSIRMGNNAKITGNVYVAGGTEAIADQTSDCSLGSCTDFIFGKNVSGQDRRDAAQSFKPASSNYLNKISLNLKKFGSPSDITVRLLEDKNGKPDKSEVLASGTLTANLVTSQYSFVDVSFDSSPHLNANTPYWIMLDSSINPSNYWSWSADSLQSYTRGTALWSSDWQGGTWSDPHLDADFKTYMGGVATFIEGSNGVNIGGDAHAHILQNLTIVKGAYFQTEQGVTAGSMHPDSPDPTTKVMPISDANIQTWKDAASSIGVYTGNITSCRSQLGPGKYVGNVSLSNHCTVTIKDPVWITGNLSLDNGVIFKLDSSYGASSGVIVVGGTIQLNNGVKIQGSGTTGSFLMALSTYDSRSNGVEAIDVQNGGNSGILYAPLGLAKVENNNHLSELTAWKVKLENGVTIDYDTGLASALFNSGPSGSYALVKGKYQLK